MATSAAVGNRAGSRASARARAGDTLLLWTNLGISLLVLVAGALLVRRSR